MARSRSAAAGDDRDDRLRECRERPDGRDRLRERAGRRRIVDEWRERAVVVAPDQQLGDARDAAEGGAQVGVEPALGCCRCQAHNHSR